MLWRRKPAATESSPARLADRVPEPDTSPELNIRPEPIVERRSIARKTPRAALEPERVPMPRRSAGARHPMVVAGNAVFSILVLVALLAGGVYVVAKNRLDAGGPLLEDKIVNIPRSGLRDVADALEHEGVITQPLTFMMAALVMKARGVDLKAGEYQFFRGTSLQDVINTLVAGKVVQHAITVPEGLTSEQVIQRLLETDVLAGNIREIPREGSLLPETFRFPRGTPREQVVQRMQHAQRQFVQETWEHRAPDLPLKSADELVTLASITEKETGRAEERSRVAAVFVNRLKQKMRLQSDPTIVYGLVGGKGSLGRPILKSEITQPTPYNTYVIDGLPPGPIANPGRASIEAAANPARTKEIYFVADGTGGHVFADNLDQHQKNVAKLRALAPQDNDSAALTSDTVESVPTETTPTPPTRPRGTRAAPAKASAPAAVQPQQTRSQGSVPRLPTQ